MIKANEIRIGNYFFDVDGNEKKIDYSDLVNLEITCLRFNPIPLTPEILERCGFAKDGYGGYKHKTLFSSFTTAGTKHGYLFRQGDKVDEPVLDYLHQLQNLYFSFKNKELEIKERKSPA